MTRLSRTPIERKTVSTRVNALSFSDGDGAPIRLAAPYRPDSEGCTGDLDDRTVDKLILY